MALNIYSDEQHQFDSCEINLVLSGHISILMSNKFILAPPNLGLIGLQYKNTKSDTLSQDNLFYKFSFWTDHWMTNGQTD